jgi:hypothetical protein
MDWKTYEEVVKNIYESLGKASGVSIECWGNSCKVLGKSEVAHQIDVLTKHSDGVHVYRTAIECKYCNDKVNKDIVMKVAYIIEDAHLNKGVIVSKKGFTEDAINTAKNKNIGLVELRELNEQDWEGKIRNIVINMNMLIPEITKMDAEIKPEAMPPNNSLKRITLDDSYIIKEAEGKTSKLIEVAREFNSELTKLEEGKEFSKIYRFKDGTILTNGTPELNMNITAFKFTGVLKIFKSTIEIKGDENILLIMNSIFENKSYKIYRDGNIIEDN